MGRNIGVSLGYVSVAMSVGLLISPVIGGAVYATSGYYAVYYVAFAIIFCDIVLRLVLIEKKVARQWIQDDEELSGSDVAHGSGNAFAPEAGAEMPEAGDGEKQAAAFQVPEATTGTAESRVEVGASARHPHWELIKTRRILGASLGVVIQAGGMCTSDRYPLSLLLFSHPLPPLY